MSTIMSVLAVTALLSSALIGGVFFAFSSFIMKSLSRVPSSEGIAAMQSINIVVLNRSFLSAFMGTAAISLLLVVLSLLQRDTAAPAFRKHARPLLSRKKRAISEPYGCVYFNLLHKK